MRLDKYLKVSRLVKRRTVASELCKAGNVLINQKVAKASSEINLGDILIIRFGNRKITAKVILVPQTAVPAQTASTLYDILSEERIESSL